MESVTAPVPIHPRLRPAHPPPWASDGQEPSLHYSIRLGVSLITEMGMLLLEIDL